MAEQLLRTLIVDDEPPARHRLATMLRDLPDVAVAGEAGTAARAARAVRELRPDLVLLDIQMPEGDGFELVEALSGSVRPAVVFVTAFSEHAVQAFEVHAVDYLLKPFTRERLELALDRVRAHTPAVPQRLDGMSERVLRRLPVESGGRILLLDPATVDYLRAKRNYVCVVTGRQSHLLRGTLSGLEQRLDPTEFLRIHRSLIVRLDRIREMETLDHGELALRLTCGATLISGRSYGERLRSALGLR